MQDGYHDAANEIDPEGPSAEDIERFDRDSDGCPSCGAEIYDDATICPICGDVLRAGSSGLPLWAIVTAVAVLVAFVLIIIP